MALSAAAGQHLRLDDDVRGLQCERVREGVLGSEGDFAARGGDAVLAEQLHAQVLVDRQVPLGRAEPQGVAHLKKIAPKSNGSQNHRQADSRVRNCRKCSDYRRA